MRFSYHYSFSSDGKSIPKEFENIRPVLTNGGKNVSVVGFIGYSNAKKQRCLHIILPKHYPLPDKAEKNEHVARLLLQTLLKFRQRHIDLWRKNVVRGEFDDGSFFSEMEYIVRDWKMYGLLRRRHRKYTQKRAGRIDWQRTLRRVQPIISHGSPVYFPPIIAAHDATKEELIQKIHAYVVWSILQDWGGLFNESWKQGEPKCPATISEMCRVLRQELRGSFIERETELVRAMLHYLEMNDGFGKRNSPQTFLVKFELIWEDICGDILDNQYDELKKKIPRAVYFSKDGEQDGVNPPIPDILCQKENGIYIFDAKYYEKAPPFYCEPCMKQFTYAYLIRKTIGRIAANVFLLPADDSDLKTVSYVGDIRLCDDNGKAISNNALHTINILHVPIAAMTKAYVEGGQTKDSMKDKIIDTLEK